MFGRNGDWGEKRICFFNDECVNTTRNLTERRASLPGIDVILLFKLSLNFWLSRSLNTYSKYTGIIDRLCTYLSFQLITHVYCICVIYNATIVPSVNNSTTAEDQYL